MTMFRITDIKFEPTNYIKRLPSERATKILESMRYKRSLQHNASDILKGPNDVSKMEKSKLMPINTSDVQFCKEY